MVQFKSSTENNSKSWETKYKIAPFCGKAMAKKYGFWKTVLVVIVAVEIFWVACCPEDDGRDQGLWEAFSLTASLFTILLPRNCCKVKLQGKRTFGYSTGTALAD